MEADYRQLVLVDDFSVEAKRQNHEQLPVTARVDRADFPTWLRENESQVQFIFHLGARTDTTEQDVEVLNRLNLDYSKEIWTLCVEFGLPLVYASSAATYGSGDLGYVDSHEVVSQLEPLNPYGRSKNDFDQWALAKKESPISGRDSNSSTSTAPTNSTKPGWRRSSCTPFGKCKRQAA